MSDNSLIKVHIPNVDTLNYDVSAYYYDFTDKGDSPIWEFGESAFFNQDRIEECVIPEIVINKNFVDDGNGGHFRDSAYIKENTVSAYTFYVNHTNINNYDEKNCGSEKAPFTSLHAAMNFLYNHLECLCPSKKGSFTSGGYKTIYIQLKISGSLSQRFINDWNFYKLYCDSPFVFIFDFSKADVSELYYSKIGSQNEIHRTSMAVFNMLNFGDTSIVKNLRCKINIDDDYISTYSGYTRSTRADYPENAFVRAGVLYNCSFIFACSKFVKERVYDAVNGTKIQYLFQNNSRFSTVVLLRADKGIVFGDYFFVFDVQTSIDSNFTYGTLRIDAVSAENIIGTQNQKTNINGEFKLQNNGSPAYWDNYLCSANIVKDTDININIKSSDYVYCRSFANLYFMENSIINLDTNVSSSLKEAELVPGHIYTVGGSNNLSCSFCTNCKIKCTANFLYTKNTVLTYFHNFDYTINWSGVNHRFDNVFGLKNGNASEISFNTTYNPVIVPNSEHFHVRDGFSYSTEPPNLVDCDISKCSLITSEKINGIWMLKKEQVNCI